MGSGDEPGGLGEVPHDELPEFAARYPKVASRLQLEPTKCEDPHVERLLEGFAFLAARVHHRLDDDLPEVGRVGAARAHLELQRTRPRDARGRHVGRTEGVQGQDFILPFQP